MDNGPFSNPNMPQPGPIVPGTQGGMPTPAGLSVTHNPMAQQLQSMGRGDDKVLVHMTPDEVGGLQQLALASGGSLTINPHTGLPEAGWLGKLLPTLLGGLLAATGVGAPLAAGIVGIGQTALTGDIGKGLMAGLGAFGGASLAGAAGLGGAITNNAFGVLGNQAGILGANMGAGAAAASAAPTAASGAAPSAITNAGLNVPANPALNVAATPYTPAMNISGLPAAASVTPSAMANAAFNALPGDMAAEALAGQTANSGVGALAKSPGFLKSFGNAASRGLGTGLAAKAAPYAAGMGLLNAVNEASMPTLRMPEDENKSEYEGPYQFPERKLQPRETRPGGEIQFFDRVNPYPGFLTKDGRLPKGYAEGGDVDLRTKDDYYLRSTGYMDPVHGQQQLSSNAPIGSTGTLGGVQFIVNPLGKWVPYTPDTAGGQGATQTQTAPPSPPPAPPPPMPSLAGPPPSGGQQPMGLGARAVQALPDFAARYRTSPGPITASRTYPGGSPSERIRRSIAGGADIGQRESDFGFAKSSNNYAPPATVTGGGGSEGYGGAPMSIFDVIRSMPGGVGGASNSDLNRVFENYIKPFAEGGEVNMKDGSFVVDARTVSELGNGSSNAGIERLSRMGGQPVRGDGDGVSDSVPARIGGSQAARVARDEVIFSPEAVAQLGGGSHSKGTQKLYALMEKAHKARKQAKRGQDTKVAKGLGALS